MKTQIKRLTKIGILLIATLLCFTSCQEQEALELIDNTESSQSKYLLTRVMSNEMTSNIALSNKLSELKQKTKSNDYAARYENIQFNLNLNEAAYIESLDGSYHSYTFSIHNEDDSYDINNIVLVSYNGQDYEAYLSTYTLTEEERNQLTSGIDINLEEKASIKPFDIDHINTYSRVGGGCFDLLLVAVEDCSCHEVHASDGCTHPNEIYEWQEVDCPGSGRGGGTSGGDGSGGTGTGTGGGGGSSGGEDGDVIPTTPMYPDGTSAAPDFLINALGGADQLTTFQLGWIEMPSNDSVVNMFLEFYSQNAANPETADFIKELITFKPERNLNALNFILEAFTQDKIYNPFDSTFLNSVNPYMELNTSDQALTDPVYIHFMLKCIALRAEHPDWSDFKIYWEASKDIVHIALDVFGLVPVVGEAADLINGVLYTIEGDGVNATLSFASAVPVAGWAAVGTKYAIKVVDATQTAYSIGTRVKLTWKVLADGTIYFGSNSTCRKQLRKALGMAPYAQDARQAHHIIPLNLQGHEAVQKAAKSENAFHLNEALNGVPLDNTVHNGSHFDYDTAIENYLNDIDLNQPLNDIYDEVVNIINSVKNAVQSNPTTHINQLNF